MSDGDERSDSSSDSEDLETTGLIATRQKRATAGNLYATLRANLDDEELQKELLAEDEEDDAGEYEGSDKGGDDDDLLESSSEEDEDAGPPKEGEQEDLDGEKALKRQERVEARKKRKLHDARLKLPAWHKKKRVKLADDVKTEDGSTSERPRKKSERSNWLPTAIDGPVRQSGRSSAIANREIVHANLKQSAERSERQRRVMKDAAAKEKTKRRMTHLSQEDRLKKCERIEKETAKDFGRWEREEAERQRLREEALAAKRKRGLEGPFRRHWSGSVLWEGDNIKVGRMEHGSKSMQEIEEDAKREEEEKREAEAKREAERRRIEEAELKEAESKEIAAEEATVQGNAPTAVLDSLPDADAEKVGTLGTDKGTTSTVQESDAQRASNLATADTAQAAEHNSSLHGIQEYATQPSTNSAEAGYTPSAPSIHNPVDAIPQLQATPTAPPSVHASDSTSHQGLPPMYHGWPPGSYQFPVDQVAATVAAAPPPPPPAPLIREQAQRTLLILDSFPTLAEPPKKIPKYKQVDTTLEADPLKKVLLPSAFPVRPMFTAEETKYFLSRPRKRGGNEMPLPAAPAKPRCALTSWQAKYRDPKTGLAYADMHQYKAIQRVLAGGCAWSGLLGCWVGSSYGPMGRPAKGVPEAFAGHTAPVKKEST